MFGFTCQFVEQKEIKTDTQLPWKSPTELFKYLRKIGKKLRNLDKFDDGMHDLQNVLQTLNHNDTLNTFNWISKEDKKRLIICYLFIFKLLVIFLLKTRNKFQPNL